MDAFDLFQVGLTVVMFTLLLVFAVRQWRARALARAEPPVQATVVVSVRDMTGSRSYRCFVDTAFDVPGRGVLMHRRGFQTEGKALLFSRLHKEGSVHWVVPNAIEPDKVFLRDDLKRSDWGSVAQVAIMGALVAYMVYLVIVEYWMGE